MDYRPFDLAAPDPGACQKAWDGEATMQGVVVGSLLNAAAGLRCLR